MKKNILLFITCIGLALIGLGIGPYLEPKNYILLMIGIPVWTIGWKLRD